MPDPSPTTHNTGNLNLTGANVSVGEQANVILGHGNTQQVYHGDVIHGNQTIIQQIVQAAVIGMETLGDTAPLSTLLAAILALQEA